MDEHSVARGWHVLGAGAIGGLFAARLLGGGLPVTLVLRDAAQRASYAEAGLTVTPATRTDQPHPANRRDSGTSRAPELERYCPAGVYRPRAVLATELAPHSVERLLITTKAHHTAAALRPITPALATHATVILLQNGMGVAELIRPLLPTAATLLQATTTEAVWRAAPFELVQAGAGITWLGAASTRLPAADRITAQWRHAGINAHPVGDIVSRLWRKLAVNCAINPFTALYQCRNGELPDRPDWLQRRDRVLDEIVALMEAIGLAETVAELRREVDRVVLATAANHSSMLQDVQAGRPTEIDFLNGYVADCSAERGLPATENRRLAEAVRTFPSPAHTPDRA